MVANYTRITRDELKDRLDRGTSLILVEALPALYFEDAHLPGAININHDQVDELAPKLLTDKNAEIVVYCANRPCPNSAIVAERLTELGYTNVREYDEGKEDWAVAGYPFETGPAQPVQPSLKVDTRERVQQLIDYVGQGRIMDAMHEFYADEVTMQENSNPPTVGKAANLVREEQFAAAVEQVHESRAESVIVDGDRAAIHWIGDYTFKGGQRVRLDQIAHQVWKNGKIVSERFFYDPTPPQAN